MKFHAFTFFATCVALGGCQVSDTHTAQPHFDDGLMGWAAAAPGGAPTGGQGANGIECSAADLAELDTCLSAMHSKATLDKPFTLYIEGEINGASEADGSGYTKADIKRSNLSIIGKQAGAKTPTLKGVWLMVTAEENLIVRNLRIVPGRDHELKEPEEGCESLDTDFCDWNAEPDALTVQGTKRVWIDHCEFSDGPSYHGVNPDKTHYKGYDGLLDIKRGADYVTVSYSVFSNHDKSILIGHSDKHDSDDFHVTFYRNHFMYLGQRVPRVRYGKVHMVNNWYENTKKNELTQKYYFSYGIGLGYKSEVYSEKNAFDIRGAEPEHLVSADFGMWSQRFSDNGSWLNGQTVDLTGIAQTAIDSQEGRKHKNLGYLGAPTWTPKQTYSYPVLDSAAAVRDVVDANAGVGKIR